MLSGNASQVSDGAAAVLLMKRSLAVQKGLPIVGVFRWETTAFANSVLESAFLCVTWSSNFGGQLLLLI